MRAASSGAEPAMMAATPSPVPGLPWIASIAAISACCTASARSAAKASSSRAASLSTAPATRRLTPSSFVAPSMPPPAVARRKRPDYRPRGDAKA